MRYDDSSERGRLVVGGVRPTVLAIAVVSCCQLGCVGDARVELAAANAIHEIAGSLQVTLEAYDEEIQAFDEIRMREVTQALAVRLAKLPRDDAVAEADMERFLEAIMKLRGDRLAAARRFAVADENVSLLREVSQGLRRLALDSMRFGDEGRRYLSAAVGKVEDRLSEWIRRNVLPSPE